MTIEEITNNPELKKYEYYRTDNGILYLGDCLKIMPMLPEKSIDMILTDPPYGISYKSNHNDYQKPIINDDFENWINILPKFLAEFKRLITDKGCCCCFCGGGGKDPVTAFFTIEAIKHLNHIQTLVWRKFIGLGWKYRPAYENAVILSKDKNNYNFFDESKSCGNVIENINQDIPKEGEHPTQKPVQLMGKLMNIHTLPNMIVLDSFSGGGSTAIAAEKLGRKWIAIEMEEEYCEIAKAKIREENSQLKINFGY